MPDEKIIDKIRKLLAKTESAGCTAEEAESAFSMAQRLMLKHSIEQAHLVASGQKSESIIKHRVNVSTRDEIKRSKLTLLSYLAMANNCKIVDATASQNEVWIIGHESDAQFVEIMMSAVLMQYAVERTREWKSYQDATPKSMQITRFKWVNSFAYGYASRIGQRLQKENKAEAKSTGSELVLASKTDAVDRWMGENLSLRSKKATNVKVNFGAMAQGQNAANKADLSGGRNNVKGGKLGELG